MANLKVGRPDTTPDAPSHTQGVFQGNAKGNYASNAGWQADGRVSAEAVTGVNPKGHQPIDKRMPNLPPA